MQTEARIDEVISPPFRVKHPSGIILWAYCENDNGFLHVPPLKPVMNIISSEAYTLKKPHWKKLKEVKDEN